MDDIQKRLDIVEEEITFANEKGKYEYTIVNGKLDESFKELETIIKKELNL